jgi:hypothetical protein
LNFYEKLDEIIGSSQDVTDIRATIRRCWFYDFAGYPLRVWQGQGKLFTSDGQEWLGTIDANGRDVHRVPPIQDGRDGSSPTYNMSIDVIDVPGYPAFQIYNDLKSEQWRVNGRLLTCHLALFEIGEGLRPQTPITFFKELVMFSPKFSEKVTQDSKGRLVREYKVSVSCKDGNYGRSNVPGGTYADTIQKFRAQEQGVSVDRGCEFVAGLANRTYQIP